MSCYCDAALAATMPNACCAPEFRSGSKGTTEKVSVFCLPSDGVLREKWKRAITRQGTGDFCFHSKYVRVCEKHFDDSDIIRADEFVVNAEKVSLRRDKLLVKPGAIPRKFEGLPVYLTKLKQKSRTLTRKSPAKRCESSSCARKTVVHKAHLSRIFV